MACKIRVFSVLTILISGVLHAESVERVVSKTLTTNPNIQELYNEYQSYKYDNDAARGNYLPSLDLEAGIGPEWIRPSSQRQRESGVGNTNYTSKDVSLKLSQLIWDGANTINDIDRTNAEAEAKRFELLTEAKSVALEVISAYLNILKSEEIIVLSEKNLQVYKEIHSNVEKRAKSGLNSSADLDQVEARIAEALTSLLAARNNLLDAQAQYVKLVGTAPKDLVLPKVNDLVLPKSIEEAKVWSFQHHPVIKTAQLDVEAATYQYKQSKSTYYPNFYIEADHSLRDDAGGIKGKTNETRAMLRLKYNLFNGLSDKYGIEQASSQINVAKNVRDEAYRQVGQSIALSWNALDITQQQQALLVDQVEYTAKTADAFNKQYKIGQRTLLDLLNTEHDLFEARRSYIDTQFEVLRSKYRLLTSMGKLFNGLLIDIPKEWTVQGDKS